MRRIWSPWPGCIAGTVISMSGTPAALIDYKVPIRDKMKSYAKYGKLQHFGTPGSRRCAIGGLRRVFLIPSSRSFRGILCASRLWIRGFPNRAVFRSDPILPYFLFPPPPYASSDRRSSIIHASPGGMCTFRFVALTVGRGFLFIGAAGFSDISRFLRAAQARTHSTE